MIDLAKSIIQESVLILQSAPVVMIVGTKEKPLPVIWYVGGRLFCPFRTKLFTGEPETREVEPVERRIMLGIARIVEMEPDWIFVICPL